MYSTKKEPWTLNQETKSSCAEVLMGVDQQQKVLVLQNVLPKEGCSSLTKEVSGPLNLTKEN